MHNQSAEGLVNLLTKANHDLTMVHIKLEREFQQRYPDDANPMKLVSRIKKIQEDVAFLKEKCHELLSAKQDLIDKARTVLVGNRDLLEQMQTSMGIRKSIDAEDSSFGHFHQVVNEWTNQVRSRREDEFNGLDFADVNKQLFSAIIQTN